MKVAIAARSSRSRVKMLPVPTCGSMYLAASTMYFQSPQDEIFLAQRKIILEAAKKGPCVIVGRCSDYILHDEGIRSMSVFVHSDMDVRKKRILERYGDIPEIEIEKRILKKDKERKTTTDIILMSTGVITRTIIYHWTAESSVRKTASLSSVIWQQNFQNKIFELKIKKNPVTF